MSKDNKSLELSKSAESLMNVLASAVPDSIKPHIVKATPVVIKIADGIEKAIPHLIKLYETLMEFWEKLSPYRPELLIPAFMGIIMCFFGGSYMTLIAAVEAYRIVGWQSSRDCLVSLFTDFKALHEANKKDDSKDDDNDGIPDVKQISSQQLLTRKSLLFLRTIDPNRFNVAIKGLQAGFLAVIATLKVQFAKAITLGTCMGQFLEEPAMKYVNPQIEKLLPVEYRKWSAAILSYIIYSTTISIAWTLQRIISAVHSALAGGLMASRNILEYLSVMKIYHIDHEKTYIDEFAGYALAVVGVFFQLSMGFRLPFILSVLLFPFSIAEWFLVHFVSR